MNPQVPHFDHRTPRQGHAPQYGFRSPRSDVGSSTTGRYFYDSGYGGSRSLGTRSVRSVDHQQSPSSQSIAGDVRDLHFYHASNYQDPSARSGTSSNTQYSMNVSNEVPPSPTPTYDLTCQFSGCGAVSKNHSEHRYVLDRSLADAGG